MRTLTNVDISELALKMVCDQHLGAADRIYGVPRGGIPVAYITAKYCNGTIVDSPEEASVIVDDIIDSGKTKERYSKYGVPFFALTTNVGGWVQFPWERGDDDYSATDIVTRTLQYIGEDPNRDGLKDTPRRVLKAWDSLYKGYKENPKEILARTFDNDEHYNEMVVLRNIEFYSMCEHHMLPFFGQAHVAYIPEEQGRVAGISKIARLVDCFAHRLQVQERMTKQIVDALIEHLKPMGAACFIEAQHLCMRARGVEKQNSVMATSALSGVFKTQAARLEFLLLKGGSHV